LSSTKDDKKKKKHPFDYVDDNYLDALFEKMQEFIDSDSFKNLVEDIIEDLSYKNTMIDRSVDVFDDEISYSSIEHIEDDSDFLDEPFSLQKPAADIMKDENRVMITLFLPSVTREDIRLYCNDSDVEIIIRKNGKQLYDVLDLPALVDPTTAYSSFHNGVLDIIVERKHRWYKGIQIDVK
jgi:HSP20 family molecular chaperone IbpA